MEDTEILQRIQEMVQTERELREQMAGGQLSGTDEHTRLSDIETELDQCWDLLRQRRALRDAREDPDRAAVRPAREVEGYRQ